MMRGVWPLLIESALILLQTVPTHIDVDVLKRKLLENIDGILAVHDFHVWQLTGDKIIASAHIRCLNLSEYMKVSPEQARSASYSCFTLDLLGSGGYGNFHKVPVLRDMVLSPLKYAS